MAPALIRYRCSRTHRQPYPPVAQEQEFVLCHEEAVGGWFDLLYVRFSFFVFGMEDDEKCSAIFAVTLVLTIMIVAAPPGIKNITAQYA